ncbi:hypothetical protein FBU30_001318 [Linnemannia zychae]|nr:hypothetical protein FBU30_001318 [Linnemannia zychae]
MPAPISPAGPSFIHLDTWDSTPPKQSPSSRPSRQLPIHRGTASTITTNSALSSDRRSVNTTVDNTYDSIESTTMFLKRFTLTSSSGHHHQPHWSSNKRRGRPGTSRIRGKHGFVKILHANSNSLNTLRCHPFSKEARSAQFKKLMQNRRLRLRQRSGGNQQQLDIDQQDGRFQDSSDMSTDESEAQDKENDEKAIDHMSFDLNPEQYRHYMWELEQRLLERTASATKSRSSFLMRRRLSASERLHHVQKVVQQQRTEQELKQHKVRVELEQKMVQAMARRNAHLEAAIENDPSRRFRHKTASKSSISVSTTTSNKVTSPKLGSTVSTAIIPVASTKTNLLAPCAVTPKKSTLSKVASPSMTRSKLMKRDPYRSVKENADSNNYNSNNISSINKNNNTQIEKDDERLHGRESPKNSTFNMTHNRKAHLTSMTSVSSLSSSSPSSSSPLSSLSVLPSTAKITEMGPIKGFQHISKEVGEGVGVDATQLERMTLWTQRRIRLRLVEKASREYMQAIGGSHQRVLELGFDELARLLHTNKALIQSTIKLLMYSSQLVQMDTPIEARSKQVKKNLARVFLSMYMILAHPYQIQSPPEVMNHEQVTRELLLKLYFGLLLAGTYLSSCTATKFVLCPSFYSMLIHSC